MFFDLLCSVRPIGSRVTPRRALLLCGLLCGLLSVALWPQNAAAQTTPLIQVPYYATTADPAKGAVFWLGKVGPAANYADVRMVYNDDSLTIVLHVFDRLTTYDENAGPSSDLTQWDAVSLYLDTGAGTYRIDSQLSHWQARTNYVHAFQWQNGGWQTVALNLATEAGFRGYPNDTDEDRGWLTSITLPFAGLGLPKPDRGATWRMALALHDRDAVAGPALPDQSWPPVAFEQPSTWGSIRFGAAAYTPPPTTGSRQLTLRHGVNNLQAPDAAVGGHSECGTQFAPNNYFNGWGSANYAGYAQFNIQNQWDVADWPCFSKYYVTFPLDTLPDTGSVISATLTMYMFGNAGYVPGDAKPSFIQVARVAENWSEETLTWNNAPPVLKNYGWTVVNPMQDGDPAAKPATWDLAQAVADAHAAGEPLRLVFYSADGDYHSGKYFWTADAREESRPLLNITWGEEGYQLSATPIRPVIRSGETARYELNVEALPSGESATLQVGPSSPPGLEIAVTPTTVAAPGGQAVVTLTDRSQAGSAAVVYTVPVKASSNGNTQETTLTVLVNGQLLYLPSVTRQSVTQ